jgi:hypothetical protein
MYARINGTLFAPVFLAFERWLIYRARAGFNFKLFKGLKKKPYKSFYKQDNQINHAKFIK